MRSAFLRLILCIAGIAPAAAGAPVLDYRIARTYSNITFSIQKFFFTEEGGFSQYDGELAIDREHPERSRVAFTVQASSIDTRNATRDDVLRSDDFFDVQHYPTLTFVSRSVRPKGHDDYEVSGDLTIRGITKRITIPVHYLGEKQLPGWGDFVGFDTSFTIDRTEFGVNGLHWGGGTAVLSKEVKIHLSIGASRKSGG